MNLMVKEARLEADFSYGKRLADVRPKERAGRGKQIEIPTIRCTLFRMPNTLNSSADGETPEVLGTAMVGCHSGDEYNEILGRKLALRQALHAAGPQAGITKLQRTRVWFAYLSTFPFAEKRPPMTSEELRQLSDRTARRRERLAAKRAKRLAA